MSQSTKHFRLWWAKVLARYPWIDEAIVRCVESGVRRRKAFLDKRPHRTLRITKRRDYLRSLDLPGYWAFTFEVLRHLLRNRRTFMALASVYAVLSVLMVGLASQTTFSQLSDILKQSNIFSGAWQNIGQASVLLWATLTGSLNNPSANSTQATLAVILVLAVWLTTIWLVRAQLSGKKPRMRDGLYRSGSPIITLFLVFVYAVIQSIPAAIGVVIGSALMVYGSTLGAINMLGWLVVIMLVVLSLYWLTSTFFASIIVTLPGMYPWQAIRAAGDLVVGRRTRILLRLVWAVAVMLIVWILVLLPVIFLVIWLDSVLTWLTVVPIVPLTVLILTTAGIIWIASYTYMLYRKVVDDASAPA